MYHVITERIRFNKSELLELIDDAEITADKVKYFLYDNYMHNCSEGSELTTKHFSSYDNALSYFYDQQRLCFTLKGTFHYTVTIVKMFKADFNGIDLIDYKDILLINSLEEDIKRGKLL